MAQPATKPQIALSASILAGGKSSRMGRDKSRLRFGRKTMLGLIRQTVENLGLPCRVIRRDIVPKCGPLSGILTALSTSSAAGELLLACDMPFVSAELLHQLRAKSKNGQKPVFSKTGEGVGFPCVLPISCLPIVENQIARGNLSLQQLAKACRAATIRFPVLQHSLNVNTPEDFALAKTFLPETSSRSKSQKNPTRPACKSPASG